MCLWPWKTMETLKHHHVLCTAWDFPPYVSLSLTQWHSGCWECAFVVEIAMWKKAVLHLCFVVVLFCCHVGLFAPSSAFPILDPHKKKPSSATSFSPLFHLPAQSIVALLLMEITLSCLLQSQRTRDKNPSSVLGGFCEDIVTVFSHCHSSGLWEEASALHPPTPPSPNPPPDCRVPNKVWEFLEKMLEELLKPHSHFGPLPQLY